MCWDGKMPLAFILAKASCSVCTLVRFVASLCPSLQICSVSDRHEFTTKNPEKLQSTTPFNRIKWIVTYRQPPANTLGAERFTSQITCLSFPRFLFRMYPKRSSKESCLVKLPTEKKRRDEIELNQRQESTVRVQVAEKKGKWPTRQAVLVLWN